jgi:hypothetical protein
LEEPFYSAGNNPFEVIMRMRNAMLKKMAPAQWYVQLDADEYFLDFAGFVQYLRQLQPSPQIQLVQCKWKTLFKKTNKGFLTIGGKAEKVPIAINRPVNTSERNHKDAQVIDTSFFILHQSWARSTEEVAKKINNWSHSKDFDTETFYQFWLIINDKNYKWQRHFHPIYPPIWPYLEKVEAKSIDELIQHYRAQPPSDTPVPPLPFFERLGRKLYRLIKALW